MSPNKAKITVFKYIIDKLDFFPHAPLYSLSMCLIGSGFNLIIILSKPKYLLCDFAIFVQLRCRVFII